MLPVQQLQGGQPASRTRNFSVKLQPQTSYTPTASEAHLELDVVCLLAAGPWHSVDALGLAHQQQQQQQQHDKHCKTPALMGFKVKTNTA